MVDLDFERRMNPWLFDDSGNLTDQARKQFPDLAQDALPVNFVASGSLSVHPPTLVQASQQAFTLQARVSSECDQPGGDVPGAAGALNGWATGPAITAAWDVWKQQVQSLADALGRIGQNLQANANGYVQADQHNQRRFAEGDGPA
ncbi:WXG100 family type VII secretion target [Kitasatospora sp. NPDC006697]|uniref:WXG100 family type VII secretion target n=1 Tax=Kitasatospora sp. NPDC006697 TaxID=3364020 RepID=UPI0036C2722C